MGWRLPKWIKAVRTFPDNQGRLGETAGQVVKLFSPRLLPRFLSMFVPLALLTGATVLALYYNDRVSEHQLYAQSGLHLVALHVDIIASELKTAESDLLYLASQAILKRYLETGIPHELQSEYVLFCRQRGVYDQIRFLDKEGEEKIRVNYNDGKPAAATELQPKKARYYFQEARALKPGQVFVSPFDLNVEHNDIEKPLKPTIRLATPLFDSRGFRGVIVLNYLGSGLLEKLRQTALTFPGNFFLLNSGGYFLRGPTSEDEWGFMLGHQRTFATLFPEAWPHLQKEASGQFESEQGLFTFRAFWPDQALRALQQELPSGYTTDPKAADPSLKAVSLIPTAVLNRRSTQLLYTLLRFYCVLLAVLLVLAWYLAYAGVLRRNQERRIAQSEARLRSLSTQLLKTHEEERRSVSRDLHDELGQLVTSMSLDLQRAGQGAEAAKKDELIARALRGAETMLDRIHEIAARVRPALLDDLGLKDAVQSLLSEYERQTGIVTKVDLRFERQDIPPVVSDNVYRILQEALTNVAKHAQAGNVSVSVHAAERRLMLAIRDSGAGFAPELLDGKRLGILGMRERTELLNGTFVLRAAPGQGTEIQVSVPL